MDLRQAVYELSAQHDLDATATGKLHQLAELQAEPRQLNVILPRGLAILAALLCGMGVIFWVAANWESLGRFGRFALLQGFFLVMCVGAVWRPAARTPLALLSMLSIGGLFAYFGQTYQTGADPWQLFALWAALGLPLCLAVRSDVLWAPWSLVAMTGISLWVNAHTGHAWRVEPDDLAIHLIGWGAALMLTFGLSPLLSRNTGAGLWALRSSMTLAVVSICITAIAGLYGSLIKPQYWIGLLVLGASAAAFASRRLFDIYVLSAVGMAFNGLIIAGISHELFSGHNGDIIGSLFLIGIIAAGLLAATVSLVLRLSRQQVAGVST
jgi:uncharacterized membrane protein